MAVGRRNARISFNPLQRIHFIVRPARLEATALFCIVVKCGMFIASGLAHAERCRLGGSWGLGVSNGNRTTRGGKQKQTPANHLRPKSYKKYTSAPVLKPVPEASDRASQPHPILSHIAPSTPIHSSHIRDSRSGRLGCFCKQILKHNDYSHPRHCPCRAGLGDNATHRSARHKKETRPREGAEPGGEN